ncbi:MAG: hypothetical protein N3A53_01895, partial [Verrucomicrobiae bacterium]|nr:hypothetical protein [Verrucomicrobiae bacterium]
MMYGKTKRLIESVNALPAGLSRVEVALRLGVSTRTAARAARLAGYAPRDGRRVDYQTARARQSRSIKLRTDQVD